MDDAHDLPLPEADRPISKAPGHWVLARAGKRVLRPGGAALSADMLRHAGLPGSDVVELAPGLGRTAAEIIKAGPASYTGIDRDLDAATRVAAIVGRHGRVRQGEAAETGLPDASADVVIGEAMLTMQGDKGKAAIVAEVARILRPGGRYAIHELAVTPDDIAEDRYTELRRDLARAIHVNARPMTVASWKGLLEEAGLEVEWSATAPMALLKASRNIRDEGLGGALRIVRNVARDKELRSRVLSMRRTFQRWEDSMAGVALVARKPG
ncbi:class I SAM-dependent methyltransferase [Actinomyces slackii]|uniref:Probable S-adenosylmethionine-dependent methyltransferase MSMEG_2350 n=1 Tax=Actinomyces slackii TaxID=52774 RepID=A0A3S4SH95_9ACTO|nr:class I SAM-dependent methyltransferase [Actinomyces slackii]VEG75979.1 Probable S-adenosylmethionine-dependent methyltransferase MSMEG_2350 [Actinomyces slackii]